MNPMVCMRPVVIMIVLAMPGWSQAATYNLFASLDGSQEVPANPSTATGLAYMTYDDVGNLFSWNISYNGLSSYPTSAHFHGPAAPGEVAPPVITIGIPPPVVVPPGEPVPETASGVLTGLSFTMSETQVSQLLSGLWYINIHTELYPGGEIRGQVQVVPIPAAAWLFGSGLLGLAALARRRKS